MLSIIFILVAAISLFLTFRYFNLARHLQNIPRSKIRSAPQGYIEIIGKARLAVPIPFYVPELKHPCVWFECSYRQGHDDSSTVVFKRSASSFLVDDGTGVCRIDPHDMRIETRSEKTHQFNKIGLDAREGLISTRWIGVGDVVQAYGKFNTLSADWRQQKKDMIKQRLSALKKDAALMHRFDTDADGDVDLAEWERAREAVINDVEAHFSEKQKELAGKDAIHVLRPPDDARMPYLVSNRDEIQIMGRYRLYALGWLILFLGSLAAVLDGDFIEWLGFWIETSLQPR